MRLSSKAGACRHAGLLQLHHHPWQAVDKADEVGPAGVEAADDVELARQQEVVLFGLRPVDDAQALGFRSTAELPDVDSAMGQDRAIAAIEFGVGIQREGYNLYVAGPTGIGRSASPVAMGNTSLLVPGCAWAGWFIVSRYM